MALKELISTIARALVDDPDGVEVTEVEGERNPILELRVSDGDVGKVVGYQVAHTKAFTVTRCAR